MNFCPVINALFEKCVRAVAKEKGTAVDSKSTQNKKNPVIERYSIMLKLLKNKKFEKKVFLSLRNS